MSLPLLVIINGPSCTGKTTLGRRIAQEFGLPFFYKDGFKERMYDAAIETSGTRDIPRDLSRLMGRFSIDSLLFVAETMLSAKQNLILEANFDSRLFSPRLAELQTRYAFHIVQIGLKADGAILLERFIRREQTDRHPGHQGLKHLEEMKAFLLRGDGQEPLAIDGDLLTLDTSDFEQLPYEQVRRLLMQRLHLS